VRKDEYNQQGWGDQDENRIMIMTSSKNFSTTAKEVTRNQDGEQKHEEE
jgi:hypothetical protein